MLLLISVSWTVWAGNAKDSKAYMEQTLEPKPFDEEQWKDATDGMDFIMEKEEEPAKEEGMTQKEYNDRSAMTEFVFTSVVRWVLILFAILFLVFIIIKVIGADVLITKGKKIHKLSELENMDEEDLELSDLEKLLKAAQTAGDHRKMIRIYYLMIIRQLSEQELIRWKKDKTNREYLREMQPHPHYGIFRDVTILFETVWYGDIDVKERDFALIGPKFTQLIHHLKNQIPSV